MTQFPFMGVVRRTVGFVAVGTMLSALVTGCIRTGPVHGDPAPVTYLIPASVTHDCSTDVTADVMRFINSVPDGPTPPSVTSATGATAGAPVVAFQPGGCYRIEGTLLVRNRHNLFFEGNGATFQAFTDGTASATDARGRSQWSFVSDTAITLHNMITRGANSNAGTGDEAYVSTLEAQHNYQFLNVTNVLVDSVRGYMPYGDFVNVNPLEKGRGPQFTTYLRVQNSTFDRNGRQGWNIAGASHVVFDHNSIANTRRATIDIEPAAASWTTTDVTISNNQVGAGRLNFLANHGAGAQMSDIRILNNVLHRQVLAIFVYSESGYRYNYTVTGNVSDAVGGNPTGVNLLFQHVQGVTVGNNTQPMQPFRNMGLVGLADAHDVSVTGNKMLNATRVVLNLDATNTSVCESGNEIGNPLRPYNDPDKPACRQGSRY